MTVNNFYNKNQFVIHDDSGNVFFQSYKSTVAKITDCGTLLFGRDWDYSDTTRKHLYLFLKEYYLTSYKVNSFVWQKVREALESSNKRAVFQRYLDEGIIVKL